MTSLVIFILSTLLTVLSTLAVVFEKNLMHACIFLLGSLIGIAGLYLSLGAEFVAATQLMVYVGGVVILMLFAIMLTGGKDFVSKAQKILGLIPAMGNMKSYIIGGLVAVVFMIVQGKLLIRVFENSKEVNLKYESTVERIGESLLTDHVLAFELSSVLLLGALVGAAIIARPRSKKDQ
jgi:NADH-quinone oxidoreductase subunit J